MTGILPTDEQPESHTAAGPGAHNVQAGLL